MNKEWICNNQCGKDCCSFIFLVIVEDYSNERNIIRNNCIIVPKDYTDFEWLGYHENIKVLDFENAKGIYVEKGVLNTIVVNPYTFKKYWYIESKCSQLMSNKRCKIYRNRPKVCSEGVCIYYDKKTEVSWFSYPMKVRR